jgi:HD-like signal output (HDOD) protein
MGHPWDISAAARTGQYGRGQHTIAGEFLEPGELLQELRTLFGSADYRPPVLPAIALEVHALTKRPDASIADVVALVKRDALLAADVLRRAQSPLYATRIPPRSLEDAASRLGLNGLRDLVFEVALSSKVFRAKGLEGPMDGLRRHSMVVAHCARAVALQTSIGDDSAFLAGLLHDVGLAAAMHALADWEKRGRKVDFALSVEPLKQVHIEAGMLVTRLWKLPGDLRAIVSAHHHPRVDNFVHPIAACVVLGEKIAHELGGCLTWEGVALDEQSPASVAAAQEGLRLTAADFALVSDRARALFERR